MKRAAVLVFGAVLFVVGCKYEVPLTEEHSIPVDPLVLGLWEPVLDDGEQSTPNDGMMVLKYSNTEYLIHHPWGNDGIY